MNKLSLIKVGGKVVENPETLAKLLNDFKQISGYKILVHGGGKLATNLSQKMGIETQMVDGRRITDQATLEVVTMVYAGWCNKNIVALLQAEGCNAIGLTGADGNAIKASRRPPVHVDSIGEDVDYGYVGDVTADSVNAGFIYSLLEKGIVPVFNAINHDGEGNLLNTNADTIASSVAIAMAKYMYRSPREVCSRCEEYETDLIYCFEKDGVLLDKNDDSSVIPEISQKSFEELKKNGIVADGMIPKLTNSFKAIDSGVARVVIKHARNLLNDKGTTLK